MASILSDSLRGTVSASDAEVSTYFAAHTNDFKIPEKRKIRHLLVDTDAMRAKMTVPPADVERAYNDNFELYSTPEQIRASHILLKTTGKDEAAVRARAEGLLKQARAGADFAQLATKNSEDEGTAAKGGDLDYFGRGRMVPEFDEGAFALKQPGQISDLIKTQYGFHIIKLVETETGIDPIPRRCAPAADRAVVDRTCADSGGGPRREAGVRDHQAGRSRFGGQETRPAGAGNPLLRAGRADHGPRRVAGGCRRARSS